MNSQNEIILYNPNEKIRLDVRLEEETVWLTQAQMTALFETTKQNISLHVKNIIKEGELKQHSTVKDFLTVQKEGNREVQRIVSYYNLDMIISVGYRVKSQRGVEFRIWATKTLKKYLLRGYAVNQRIDRLEHKIVEHDQKFDLLIKTTLPPKEGIFYDGQIFDAYKFISDLIETAKKRIVVIDNYADASVLTLLSKRKKGVKATIYTKKILNTLQLDLNKHNTQYPEIFIEEKPNIHDRFLMIDNDLYHIGASLKDLGKKLFAFSKMEMKADELKIKN